MTSLRLFGSFVIFLSHVALSQTALWQSTTGPVTSFASNSNGVVVAGFWQGGVGILRSTDNGVTWIQSNSGLSNRAVRSLYVTPDGTFLAGTQQGIHRSTDAGATWLPSSTGYASASYAMSFAHTSPTEILSVSYSSGAYRSTDNGGSWSAFSTGFGSYLRCILRAPSGDFFIGTSDFGVIRSTNGGTTWSGASAGLLHNDANSMTVDSSGILFVGTWGKGVFTSTDQGGSWTSVNAGLPDSLIQDIVALGTGEIYVATSRHGIYRSTNHGTTWDVASSGMTDATPYDLHLARSGYLFVGTLMGGICRSVQAVTSASTIDNQSPDQFRVGQNYPNPFNPSTSIDFTLTTESHVLLKVYNSLGQQVTTLVDERRAPGLHHVAFDASRLSSGTYYCVVTANHQSQTVKALLIR